MLDWGSSKGTSSWLVYNKLAIRFLQGVVAFSMCVRPAGIYDPLYPANIVFWLVRIALVWYNTPTFTPVISDHTSCPSNTKEGMESLCILPGQRAKCASSQWLNYRASTVKGPGQQSNHSKELVTMVTTVTRESWEDTCVLMLAIIGPKISLLKFAAFRKHCHSFSALWLQLTCSFRPCVNGYIHLPL